MTATHFGNRVASLMHNPDSRTEKQLVTDIKDWTQAWFAEHGVDVCVQFRRFNHYRQNSLSGYIIAHNGLHGVSPRIKWLNKASISFVVQDGGVTTDIAKFKQRTDPDFTEELIEKFRCALEQLLSHPG